MRWHIGGVCLLLAQVLMLSCGANHLTNIAAAPKPALAICDDHPATRMRQPDRRNPAPTQALLQAVARQMAIQDRRQAQPLHRRQQQREIINAFGGNRRLRCHPLSFPVNSRSRWKFQRTDRHYVFRSQKRLTQRSSRSYNRNT